MGQVGTVCVLWGMGGRGSLVRAGSAYLWSHPKNATALFFKMVAFNLSFVGVIAKCFVLVVRIDEQT